MIPYIRYALGTIAENACALVRLCRRSRGRHAAAIGPDEPWYPSTPMPAPPPPELHHPRVPRYVESKPARSEWLSARYAELYQWVAEMELRIYASDVRASHV